MTMMHQVALAVTRIPLAGQQLLASRGSRQVRAALATSPTTEQSVVEALVSDGDPDVRKYAHARTHDVGRLDAVLRTKPGVCTPFAARNPFASPDALAAVLDSSHRGVALNAWCNPATPEEARRALTVERASELCRVGGSTHDHAVRAFELVIANPWMAHDAARWGGEVRRALCGLPGITAKALQVIRKAGRHGSSTAKRHPALQPDPDPRPLEEWSLDELALWGSTATDLVLAEHPLLDAKFAHAALHANIEPHVLGRLVNRFGSAELLYAGEQSCPPYLDWSGTRYKAATWVAPVLGFVSISSLDVDDVRQAGEILASDQIAWETFLSLLGNWHDSLTSAATTALAV